jgi:phenylalanyl-tRNA synthetase beta chain
MKFSESWLREWVNPTLKREQLCEKLTMAGLEIESAIPIAEKFSGVIVAQVVAVTPHPEADRLNVCEVNIGKSKNLTIVCGASNVKANMKVAAALGNAVLANDFKIKNSTIRGIISEGMLCSAQELGLGEDSEGLFELPANAPLGTEVWDYLKLEDYLIDVSITPNRGDCLSIRGMAKEVAALTQAPVNEIDIPEIKAFVQDVLSVNVHAKSDCPCYIGRVIREVDTKAITPVWMREHLRRGGIRSISAIVDIMNYVMLELGQPMHAFSLDKLQGSVEVRLAKKNEIIKLLDDSEIELEADTLIIADQKTPLAIAGVMGGLDSAVTLATKDVFLESAFFKPTTIARAARKYNLSSDSAYRFERGIDPELQRKAMERATELVLEISGGNPGPIIEVTDAPNLPQPAVIDLSHAKVTKILGCDIPASTIEIIFDHLNFVYQKNKTGWQVTVPARRSDISRDVDLIEEIARLYGYDEIPCHQPFAKLQIANSVESKVTPQVIRRALCDLGYHEVVTYSFIDKKMQTLFEPKQVPLNLVNPMTPEMAVMRTSLLPGLMNTWIYNQNRQQSRIRLFETGLRFIQTDAGLVQARTLSGLISGTAQSEQWGIPSRAADFFDIKGDLQNLFTLTHAAAEFIFQPSVHPALHPGKTAQILRDGRVVGVVGGIHPAILQALKIEAKIFLFEIFLNEIEQSEPLKMSEISKFPEIRRDLAILLDQSVPTVSVQDTIKEVAGELLKEVDIFDVYQGKGIDPGRKSIALALTLQHSSRTLIDEEVAKLMERVIEVLNERFNAELRG